MTTYYVEQPQDLLDDTVALRRCALWRNAFRDFAVSYPAELLGFEAAAGWMRRHRVTVDVATAAEFNLALASGVRPAQLVMHPRNGAAITRGLMGQSARFVIDSDQQARVLARGAQRIAHVFVPGGAGTHSIVAEVLGHRRLDLVGLHSTADPSDDPVGFGALRSAVAEMAAIRRRYSVVLSRVSLAGLDGGRLCLQPWALRRVAEALGEVLEEQCAHYRYPRPALTVAPSFSALMPRNVNVA
ncbi:hypothetical protein [Mycobacterium sp. NPDC050441]|uniref:hypothetical protein n=1 Tax=Mycobacterium sp. NPDC050441 TaxID=3155403 RepID=UPI0033C3E455